VSWGVYRAVGVAAKVRGTIMKPALLAAMIVVLLSRSSLAAENFWANPWMNAETREKRIQLAVDIRNELKIDEFLAVIPTLSPREEEWLEKERLAGGNRAMESFRSNEFFIQNARRIVESLNFLLKKIVKDEANEFGYWVNLAYILMDNAETEYFGLLCERDIVKPCPIDYPSDYRLGATLPAKIFAQRIVMGVLGPKFGVGFGK